MRVRGEGGTVARAKTTDRSDARRRYRAQLAAEAADAAAAEAAADADAVEANVVRGGTATPNVISGGRPRAPRTDARRIDQGGPASAPRLNLLASLRTAATPADLVGDVRAFPQIATRTKAVWLPALLVVATGAAFLVPALAENTIVRLLGQALLAPPAMIPSFLAGMLTQRGSWLAGGVAGLIAGLTVAVVISVSPASASTTTGLDLQNLAFILVAAPVFGVGVGAFSGFYRRFLALSSGPRQQRRPAPGAKGSAKRR
jgi:hypothetical protein